MRCGAERRSAPQSDAGSLPAHVRHRFRGSAESPSRLFELKDFEVNSTNNREGHVADGYAARGTPFECPQMRMAVNDEIRHAPVEYDAQFTVPEHPILGEGLLSKRGRRRREVHGGDAHVSVQRKKGSFQCRTFAAGANGKPFQGSRVDGVWSLVRPESATATGRPGDANAQSVCQANHDGATVEHLDATTFEHASEGCSAQRSQVMIAKHRDNGQARCREELASRLGFQEASVLGEVPGNQQKVGLVREAGKTGDRAQLFSTAEVEVANGRDPNPQTLRGAALDNRRWQ
jgi:hypothetical protein